MGPGPERPGRRRIIREIRGIPFFLLREYLEDLGGSSLSESRVEGPGWQAELVRMEPFRIGSLAVGQTRLVVEIEEALADRFMERLDLKTLRAGA